MMRSTTLLKYWIAGMAFSGALIVLDYFSVHTPLQAIVILFSLPQFMVSALVTTFIVRSDMSNSWLFNGLMIFWGGLLYGALIFLGGSFWRRVRRRRNDTA